MADALGVVDANSITLQEISWLLQMMSFYLEEANWMNIGGLGKEYIGAQIKRSK